MKKILIFCISVYISLIALLFPSLSFAKFDRTGNNPVLSVGINNEWDRSQVYGPSVLIQENNLMLWYSGSNGIKREIGIANSLLFGELIKNSNPVINWNVINKNDIGIEHPSVIVKSLSPKQYWMWFSNVGDYYRSFNIYFTDSFDGLLWNTPKSLIFYPNNTTWDSDGMGAPSVLKDSITNNYKMWYVCKGSWMGSTKWRIGYAESGDGISWTKHEDPVLVADEAWEGADVGNPTVIYDGGVYHMWYHGDHAIGHATSTDGGITWVKDKNNPVLTPSTDVNAFDAVRVFNPFVLRVDNAYFMWYTGINKAGNWQIGLAKEVLNPAPTSTPTPTPTLIPSPTLTPSPTPTPTQTQSFSPVIIVPGLGASWNPRSLFSCDLKNSSNWKLAPFVSVYRRLITTLTKNAGLKLNKDVYVYGYDWRQDLDTDGASLKNYIDTVLKDKPAGTKVRLIGHSLGGLVIRSLLTNYPDYSKVESVLTAGSPHKGTVMAYPIWEKGEIPLYDRVMRFAVNNMVNICRARLRLADFRENKFLAKKSIPNREVVQKVIPVIKQLLPAFDYLKMNGEILDSAKLKNQNEWLTKHPAFLTEIPLYTLSGNKKSTSRYLVVTSATADEIKAGDWIDGKPVSTESTAEGDGTILNLSSRLENGQNWIIDGEHAEIVYSASGIAKILEYLGLDKVKVSDMEPVPEVTSASVLTFSSDNISHLNLTSPAGEKFANNENIIAVFDPKAGLYRLKLQGGETDTAKLYIEYLGEDNKSLSKDFDIRISKGKIADYLVIFTNFKTPALNLIPLK